ncbi:copper chaperone PCu(A)C [Pseudoroseicyclus sp. CXY001]|uniref:copper chaperone PCu(A)C n=1 Tax=Pseudoroseicyclus sp. CXY001 TaxID=3242492 RepID=UPI003570ACFC
MPKITILSALLLSAMPGLALAGGAARPGGDAPSADRLPVLLVADEVTSWEVGALTILGAYSRATLPNAPVGGGFLTVENGGETDDVLIAASSPTAGSVELHEMQMDGDVMRMRELEDGLPIPAGETVVLEPGGYHLMLRELEGPLVEGTEVPVTLTFAEAGAVEIVLSVGAINASGATGQGMDHGSMGHGDDEDMDTDMDMDMEASE